MQPSQTPWIPSFHRPCSASTRCWGATHSTRFVLTSAAIGLRYTLPPSMPHEHESNGRGHPSSPRLSFELHASVGLKITVCMESSAPRNTQHALGPCYGCWYCILLLRPRSSTDSFLVGFFALPHVHCPAYSSTFCLYLDMT